MILHVAGELDLLTAPRVSHAFGQALDRRARLLVADLSNVEFLGCAGLSALVAARRRAGRRTCLRVAATERITLRPLRITGLDQFLALYDSLDAALTDPVSTDHTETLGHTCESR